MTAVAAAPTRIYLETRCRHGMVEFHTEHGTDDGVEHAIKSSCSICRDLPYESAKFWDEIRMEVAEIDTVPHLPVSEPLQWLRSEVRSECAWCSAPIREGHEAAFVPELDGPIGRCCQDQVA